MAQIDSLGDFTEKGLAQLQQHIAQLPVDANRIKGLTDFGALVLFRDTPHNSNSTGYADIVDSAGVIEWQTGLTPSFLFTLFAMTGSTTVVTMTAALTLGSQNAGGVEASVGSYGTEFGDTAVTHNGTTTPRLIASGWVTPTLPATADFLNVKLRGKSSNTTNAKTWDAMSVYVKWS